MRLLSIARKTFLLGAALAACGGLAAGTARADLIGIPVAPGQLVNLPGEGAANLANETIVASETVNTALFNPNISANLVSAVYRDSAGVLDFVFQLTNNANSVPLQSIDLSNYGLPGSATTVNYLTGPLPPNATLAFPAGGSFVPPTGTGTLNPTQVQRGPAAGNDLLFNFDSTGLRPGATSNLFFIHTNATNFNQLGQGLGAAVNSAQGAALFPQKYEPTNAVPEPSMFAMMGVAGAFGLGYYRKLRRNRAAA